MLAIDRLLAVWKPSSYKRFCSSAKIIATMVILHWIAGFGFDLTAVFNTQSSGKDNGSYVCIRVQVERSPENIDDNVVDIYWKGSSTRSADDYSLRKNDDHDKAIFVKSVVQHNLSR
jgi:hypothetical protein